MGKINKTYDVTFKKKTVDRYLKDGMGYDRVALGIGYFWFNDRSPG